MPNRILQPELVAIDSIDFVAPKQHVLSDTTSLYHMKDVPNETSRFDLYFDAGVCRGQKGIPSFVNGLLMSGTKDKTSNELQSEINSLGGFLDCGISIENSVVTVYCLREHLPAIFKTVVHAIQGVTFDKNEVQEYLVDRRQSLKISQEKVGYLAQQRFREKLFASSQSYSYTLSVSDIDAVTIEELRDFHKKHYLNGLNKVVVVGDISDEVITEIKDAVTPIIVSSQEDFTDAITNEPGKFEQEKEGAVQAAVRLGRTLFNKNHDDYLDFLILNTILGDYFGSRLMTNIREDKGYTYGIGSMIAELNGTGYFLIATEVGSDVKDATLKEIQIETERLQSELVSEDELELVRNYMLGQLLKSANGPYAMTDLFLSAEIHGKSLKFYNQALASIRDITPERIQELAKKYLKWDDFSIVAVG